MKRMLTTAMFLVLLVIGNANAQTPIDYTLTCDGEIIGVVSSVDGTLRVAILEGVTCEGELSIAGDETLDVTLEWDIDGATVTIAGESVLAEEVPAQALAGMVTAHEHRAAAFAHRTRGEEEAAAARERRPDLPEAIDHLPDLPELDERQPDLPAAAGNRR